MHDNLGKCGPVIELFEALSDGLVLKNIKCSKGDFFLLQKRHGLLAESTSGLIRVAFHEQDDVALFHQLATTVFQLYGRLVCGNGMLTDCSSCGVVGGWRLGSRGCGRRGDSIGSTITSNSMGCHGGTKCRRIGATDLGEKGVATQENEGGNTIYIERL